MKNYANKPSMGIDIQKNCSREKSEHSSIYLKCPWQWFRSTFLAISRYTQWTIENRCYLHVIPNAFSIVPIFIWFDSIWVRFYSEFSSTFKSDWTFKLHTLVVFEQYTFICSQSLAHARIYDQKYNRKECFNS